MVLHLRTYLTACLNMSQVPNPAPQVFHRRPARCAQKMATKKHGEVFCFYGPMAWNKLPLFLWQAAYIDIFKAQLKTYLYTLAFNWSFKFLVIHVLIVLHYYYYFSYFNWSFKILLFMSSLCCSTAVILMFYVLRFFCFLLFSFIFIHCSVKQIILLLFIALLTAQTWQTGDNTDAFRCQAFLSVYLTR